MVKVGLWRRNEVYYLRWRDNGIQVKQSLGKIDGAAADRQRLLKEVELANPAAVKVERQTFALENLLKKYLAANKKIESSTRDLTTRAMSYFISVVGDLEIDRVKYAHAEKFQGWCIETGRAQTTANIWAKTIRPVFRWAIRQRMIAADPFEQLELFRIPKGKIRVYERKEFTALIAACPNKLWRARLMLAKTAGLRRSEILNLTLDDVDFDRGMITVQAKAENKFTWRWLPKDKDRRRVPLILVLAKLLTEIFCELPSRQPYIMITAHRYQRLLEMRRRGKMTDRLRVNPDENWSGPFGSICDSAGVKNRTFHDLRRTAITEWLESDLKPHEAQALAGHSSVNTTMDYYAGIRDELVDKARAASQRCLV